MYTLGTVPFYRVQQGECLSSIAAARGFDWNTIWARPENSALRDKRKNPNVLLPGDSLFVPDKDLRYEARPTDQLHQFVKPAGVKLKICLLAAGMPIANEPYKLQIDGKNLQGSTDKSGILEETVPPYATDASLVLENQNLTLPLKVGYLDPPTEISGVQGRLNNLGFHCGAADGIAGPLTQSALLAFQETYQLDQTGKPDAVTQEKLRSEHGC
jgi:hypothetical protein